MSSLREIKRRLRSIQNTQQIMRAMQLVSASKFKRSQGILTGLGSVMEFLDGLLHRTLAAAEYLDSPASLHCANESWSCHPLCAMREDNSGILVVFTSDAGLCGAYNTSLIQLAESHLRRDSLRRTQIVYVGRKGYRYLTKRGYKSADSYLNLAGRPDVEKSQAIGRALIDRFVSGSVGFVELLYSRFISATIQRPIIERWLPISLSTRETARSKQTEYIFEPSPKQVFDELLPRWALAKFELVTLEAFTSEHSARMIAMKNATDNAAELSERLTTQRNKIRQASITKEISEIVGTAEALK